MPGPPGDGGDVRRRRRELHREGQSTPPKSEAAWRYAKYLDEPEDAGEVGADRVHPDPAESAVDHPAVQQLWQSQPFYKVAYDQLATDNTTVAAKGPVIGDFSRRAQGRDRRDGGDGHERDLARETRWSRRPTTRNKAIKDYNERAGVRRVTRVPLPGHDDAARVGAAPDGVGEPDARAVDLAVARVAAELMHELDDLAERRRAERLALRQQAAARVHRRRRRARRRRRRGAAPARRARTDPSSWYASSSRRGVGVLALDDVDVVGPDARLPRTRPARRASTAA